MRGDEVDERHVAVAREVGLQSGAADRIGLRLDAQIEHAAARVAERPGVRVVGALPQHAALVGHERRDHVDQLRQAPDAHAIRIAEQRVDEAADEQRVLEVVDLLEQPRRGGAAAVGRLSRRARGTTRSTRRTTATGACSSAAGPARSRRRPPSRGCGDPCRGSSPGTARCCCPTSAPCCRSRRGARCRRPGRSTPRALRDPRPDTSA